MRRRFKLLAVLIGVPAVLVSVAAIVLPMLADSVHYRREVIALVKERTGFDLHIDGDVRLRVFPQLRLTVTDVRLANPPGFSNPDFARLPWLAVDIKLLPLLAGHLEPRAIVVTGPHLHIERDRRGRGNWESAARQDTGGKQRTASPATLAALAVGKLRVRDATVHWRDHASGETITLAAISLQTGAVRGAAGIDDARLQLEIPGGGGSVEVRGDVALDAAGERVVIPNLTATFHRPGADGMQVDGTLNAGLTVAFREQRLALETLAISARGLGSDEREFTLEVGGELGIDLARQRLEASTLTATLTSFSLPGMSGALTLEGALSGDLRAGTYGLENMRGNGKMTGKALSDAKVDFSLAGALNTNVRTEKYSALGLAIDGSVDDGAVPFSLVTDLDIAPRAQTLTATAMRLSIHDWRAEGAMTLRAAASPTGVQGVLDLRVQDQPVAGSFAITESETNADSVDVRLDMVADLDLESGYTPRGRHAVVLRASVTPESADGFWHIDDVNLGARVTDGSFPDGELRLKLQADIAVNVDEERVRSDNVQLAIDDSRIVGSVHVQRFDKPVVRIDLQADNINADRYLLPAAGSTGGGTGATPIDASIEAIRALDFAGEVRVQTLTLKGMQLKNVRVTSGGAVSGG
jgi:hypothetical protein